MRTALLAAGMTLLSCAAGAADCSYTPGSNKDNPGVISACKTQIQAAVEGLKSSDPAVKARAAQSIADAKRQLDVAWESLIDEENRIENNGGPGRSDVVASQADVSMLLRDHKDDIDAAQAIVQNSTARPPGSGRGSPTAGDGATPPTTPDADGSPPNGQQHGAPEKVGARAAPGRAPPPVSDADLAKGRAALARA